MRVISIVAAFGLFLVSAGASAQPVYAPGDDVFRSEAATPAPVPLRPRQPTVQAGLSLGVPIFLDVDREIVRPGVNLQAYAGIDLGYLMIGLSGGYGWVPLNLNSAPGGRGIGREPLKRAWFGPVVQLQLPLGPVLPYMSASFDFNWWNFLETDIACDYWYCREVNTYRFTPGITARVGAAVQLGPGLMVDLGVRLGTSFQGRFFDRTEHWVEPYLGVIMQLGAY